MLDHAANVGSRRDGGHARGIIQNRCGRCKSERGFDFDHVLILQYFSDTLTIVPICRVAQGARFRRSVDRNSFRSPRGARDSGNVQPRPLGSTFVRTAIIRYAPLAVGVNPSAMQGEARLRGLYRNNYSKTISPRLWNAKPACTGSIGYRLSAIGYRLSAIGYRLSAIGYDKPSAMECEARRLHGRERSNCSTTTTAANQKTRYAQSLPETVDCARGHHLNRLLRVAHGLHLFQAHPQAAQRHRRF